MRSLRDSSIEFPERGTRRFAPTANPIPSAVAGYARGFAVNLRSEGMIRAIRTALPATCMISIG